ncbi:MAG: U32 family peptidase [Eubacteriales bacterium]|nr:U32 family peptidase [Eubacteriales bacterium]
MSRETFATDFQNAENAPRKIELLAPCGSEEAFIAAVENGADAVYVGGQLFNARAHAHNFDRETMRRAISYAHRNGVFVHVTMNTLLRDDELEDALRYAEFLYETGADALIVQDLGLASLIHQAMPDFELHESTQGTVSDLASAGAARKFGFSRVVLSRELSLSEIRSIALSAGIDTEIFAHGALCFCYSGQCQMSRYFGGRSGNRGECAQPCRLRWKTENAKGDKAQAALYPLSMKDLCLLSDLPDLIQAGVRSLKIEGRMKSPEYVAVTVAMYRKYIDQYYREGRVSVATPDLEALYQIFNRGQFTDAYLRGGQGGELISGEIPKNQGIRIGTVIGRPRRGRGEKESLVDIKVGEGGRRAGHGGAEAGLEIGDGAEIREARPKGERPRISGNVISYRKEIGRNELRIGDLRGDIRPGDLVYRTSSKKQLEDARRTFRGKSFDSLETKRKIPVLVRVSCTGHTLEAEASAAGKTARASSGAFEVLPDGQADSFSAFSEKLQKAFSKTGGTPFYLDDFQFRGSSVFHGKRSEMNALRREVYESLMNQLSEGRKAPVHEDPALISEMELLRDRAEKRADSADSEPKYKEIVYYRYEDLEKDFQGAGKVFAPQPAHGKKISVLLPASEMLLYETELRRLKEDLSGLKNLPERKDPPGLKEDSSYEDPSYKEEIRLIPYIPSVVRGTEERILRERMEDLRRIAAENGIYSGNIGWALELAEMGAEVHIGSGLNVYNYECEKALRRAGLLPGAESLETLDHTAGAYPLMVSEHRPEGSRLVSGDKAARILKRSSSRQTVLLPDTGEAYWVRYSRWDGEIQGRLAGSELVDSVKK